MKNKIQTADTWIEKIKWSKCPNCGTLMDSTGLPSGIHQICLRCNNEFYVGKIDE